MWQCDAADLLAAGKLPLSREAVRGPRIRWPVPQCLIATCIRETVDINLKYACTVKLSGGTDPV